MKTKYQKETYCKQLKKSKDKYGKKKGINNSKSQIKKDKNNEILALLDIDANQEENNIRNKDITITKKFEDNRIDNIYENGKILSKDEMFETKDTQISIGESIKDTANTQKNSDNQKYFLEKNIENELKNYEKEVLEFLKEEKTNIINIEEKKEIIIVEKQKKKVTSIEVEENINTEAFPNMPDNTELLEVKDKIFKINKNNTVEDSIYYDGKLFKKDRHQLNSYPKIVKYRCKNYRKKERNLNNTFCPALLKRKLDKNNYYYILETNHSTDCLETEITKLKIKTNLIGHYNEYIDKCMSYLNGTDYYDRKEFTTKLQEIYNENKYDFKLKENTIKNIIGRWKLTSLRFTKYSAIENKYNKKGELILYDYSNTIIYTSSKKKPVNGEYFIWSSDSIIARIRKSNHLFIDTTFHHPKDFTQLLIIIFKDYISSEYYPGFFILMSNKTEILYDLIFKSLKRIISQQNIYNLTFKTITTDTEIALINAVERNFDKIKRIGCWFHLSQDLIREARLIGLLNSKNKDIDINLTYEIITQLTLLPINYKGNIENLKKFLNVLIMQYPHYSNYIINYFIEYKLKYFQDGSYDYSKFPPDIRSNSILERYNKIVKNQLGEKRTCNWVVFMNFIFKELERISEKLGKNENINVLYSEKNTKFGKFKYNFTNFN